MAKRWKLEDAKAKFSQVVEEAVGGEPQLITRRGREAVVVLGVREYERLRGGRSVLDALRELGDMSGVEFERIHDAPREVDLDA